MKSAAEKVRESDRQLKILEMLADGKERKEIGDALGLSLGTVNTYISRLYLKLGATSPAHALKIFITIEHRRLELF